MKLLIITYPLIAKSDQILIRLMKFSVMYRILAHLTSVAYLRVCATLRVHNKSNSSSLTCTHAFTVARAVVCVMRVEFHIGAAIKGVQAPEEALQRVSLEEGVILGYAGNVYRKLIVWNTNTERNCQFLFATGIHSIVI